MTGPVPDEAQLRAALMAFLGDLYDQTNVFQAGCAAQFDRAICEALKTQMAALGLLVRAAGGEPETGSGRKRTKR